MNASPPSGICVCLVLMMWFLTLLSSSSSRGRSFNDPMVDAKCSHRFEVGRNLYELLVVSLQALAIQPSGNKGSSSCDDTLTLKSMRAQDMLYVVNIMRRYELRYSM
ncbi:hypothetical protein PHAVU_002G130800 [Phaseolus vulgaris]|uniref:Uncharacterized protein n=1 Tax=Phaseolus vulgaris TaxID=3885 RepID=V7CJ34_PHAVU|nr:hypothetical protein PHAVU_002G130800g [Phaseolus vulgaris]XP_007158179.1 hypothetical protein PHAVU_002G130800g [Phaseolus vulgaris]ESW30172.1 hypothetical protein PHAVU_002G130800g [Phaseolus vulgaris]ESW30173.1 hypothetical protein PHAVU_002G130800g [Phaseolus vulgaris]